MKLAAQLSLRFNGECEAAFKFYERCFDGKIAIMLTWGDSPMAAQAPPGWGEKILHGRISISDTDLIGGDVLPSQYEQPKGFSVLLNVDDPVAAERIFNALADNGTVQWPFQKTFWAARYGGLIDRFGIPWEINCEEVSGVESR
jgi:PhnB protein